MLTDLSLFFSKYLSIILFYVVIIVLVIWQWKKITVQAKFILLYRTTWGLRWMDKYSQKYREWVILLGYIGTGIGFLGMVFISYFLLKNLYDLFVTPEAVSGVSLVLPGINVPGLGILPFWHWLLAIFLIAVIHEFSHGIVARAHNIPVKNSGIVLFGPVIGAFVEPDEKKLTSQSDIKQYSVLAAGAFSNIVLALVALVLLNLVFSPLQQTMVQPTGFIFDTYVDASYPFAQAGIAEGTRITGVDGKKTPTFQDFQQHFLTKKPGDTITVSTETKEYHITLAESPDTPGQPFLGIRDIRNDFEVKEQYHSGWSNAVYLMLDWWNTFLRWLFLLSFGIGLFNLLPLPIVDGGRMIQVFLQKLKGLEKGNLAYQRVSLFFLLILLFTLFFPLLTKLF